MTQSTDAVTPEEQPKKIIVSGKMENKYKYLIERKDTNQWYRLNLTGYYGHTYTGEPFGEFPEPENNWTKDGNEALQFNTKESANTFLNGIETAHGLDKNLCEVTEHEFVQGNPQDNAQSK